MDNIQCYNNHNLKYLWNFRSINKVDRQYRGIIERKWEKIGIDRIKKANRRISNIE
jgi:hypothetical protein